MEYTVSKTVLMDLNEQRANNIVQKHISDHLRVKVGFSNYLLSWMFRSASTSPPIHQANIKLVPVYNS